MLPLSHVRTMLFFALVLLTPLLGQAQAPSAQGPNIRFEQITELPGALSIVQDHQGFMWFAGGSPGGLHRYDDYRVKTYENDLEDECSLSHNWVESLLIDTKGTLWIGVFDENGGLHRYEPDRDCFTRYQNIPDDLNSLSDNLILVMLEDQEGMLWIGTAEGGLNRFDPETDIFIRYQYDPEDETSLSDNVVRVLYQDRAGTLWVGTGEGLNRFDAETGTFTRYQHDPENETGSISKGAVWALFEDSRGVFWVGTRGDDGLHTMDRAAGTFTHLPYDPENLNKPSMPHLRQAPYLLDPGYPSWRGVRFIHEDQQGILWIGGFGGGIDRYDSETETLSHYEAVPGDVNGLGNNLVWTIYESQDGAIWIGTWGSVYKALPSVSEYEHFKAVPTNPNSLSHDNVWGFSEDHEGNVWIGTWGGGLNKHNIASGVFSHFRYTPANPHTDNAIRPIIGRDGTLWVGAIYGGLSRLDPETGRISHQYTHDPQDSLSLSGTIMWPFEDRQERLWVGTFFSGLNQLIDRENGIFKRYEHNPENPSSLSGNTIRALFEDESGVLWIGTNKGLDRFNPEDESFDHFLVGASIMALYEDTAERFWVGTRRSLLTLNRETGASISYTTAEGLPEGGIAGIVEDEAGFLWISTYEGAPTLPLHGRICRYNPETGVVSVFGPEDGLPDIGYSYGSVRKRRDGMLMFGGHGGFITIDPKTFVSGFTFASPQITLTELRIFNDKILPGEEGPLKRPIRLTRELELGYDKNDFTVDYSGMLYRDPGEIRYRYLLENHDHDWVEARTQRSARYSGLEPGKYVFRVKAVSSKGVWSETDASVTINILPPWWRTWWAYAVYAMVLIGAVVSTYRMQHARIVRREREQAQIREAELRAEAAELQAKATEAQARALETEHERDRIELEKAHEVETAYHELKTTQAQLVQAEKMASLGALTAGIAHEIKNPLNFVNNFAELNEELVEELREEIRAGRYQMAHDVAHDLRDTLGALKMNTAQIAKHGKRADRIVQGMMEHAHDASGERYDVGVNKLVEEQATMAYQAMLEQVQGLDVQMERHLDASVGSMEMAPQELGRALLAVLNNALDAVNKKAQASDGNYKPAVKVATRRVDGQVEIRVCDNGPGIREEMQQKIFEPFFTTKPTGTGTGLGLSLAYDIITQGHGGTLTVESTEGDGATFIITIPDDTN